MQVHERSRNSSQFPEPVCGTSQPLQWPRVSTHRRRRLTAVPRSRIFRSGLGPRPSACSYLILGSHTKRVTVIGLLVPTQGTSRIFPSTPGVVTQRRVEEGQRVRRGDLLFVLSDDRRAADAAGNARVADTQATSLAQRRESMLRTIGTLRFLRNQTQEGLRTRLQILQKNLSPSTTSNSFGFAKTRCLAALSIGATSIRRSLHGARVTDCCSFSRMAPFPPSNTRRTSSISQCSGRGS
mgnify:CR=1 FL=1